jgi:hypothetical protein
MGKVCPSTSFDFLSHMDVEETPLDRELQSKALAKIMADAYPTPVIFLGYVVTKPHWQRREFVPSPPLCSSSTASAAPYQILVEDGKVHDIDEDDKERWCEYILYRGWYPSRPL